MRRGSSVLAWVVVCGFLVAGGLVWWAVSGTASMHTNRCIADVADTRVEIDLEQAQWSALISSIAHRRGIPARGTTIAIATAFQESKIRNIDYGDRDSLGLFQQRPSQGWGTPEQVLDPHHATNAFYDELETIRDYARLEVTQAAQAVQRSGFPDAYADHEDDARALASSLRGHSPAAFWCEIGPQAGGSADEVAAAIRQDFGAVALDVEGDTVRVRVPGRVVGWMHAHHAVANAHRLGVERVVFDDRRWSAAESADGWTADSAGDTSTVVIRVG